MAHAYPPHGILNIIFWPKTGVFRIFAMLGTPKPMEEIAPRHHKVFFLCLRHKNPYEIFFQKNRRPKSVTTTYNDDNDATGVALARYAPMMGGLVPCPAALAGIFSKEVNKKLRYLQ